MADVPQRALTASDLAQLAVKASPRCILDEQGRPAFERSKYEDLIIPLVPSVFFLGVALAVIRWASTVPGWPRVILFFGLLAVLAAMLGAVAWLVGTGGDYARPLLFWPYFAGWLLVQGLAFARVATRSPDITSIGNIAAGVVLFLGLVIAWQALRKVPKCLDNQTPDAAMREFYRLLIARRTAEAAQYYVRFRNAPDNQTRAQVGVGTAVVTMDRHEEDSACEVTSLEFTCPAGAGPIDEVIARATLVLSRSSDVWTSPTPDWTFKTGMHTETQTSYDDRCLRRFDDGWFIDMAKDVSRFFVYLITRSHSVPGSKLCWCEIGPDWFSPDEGSAKRVGGPFVSVQGCDEWIAGNPDLKPRGQTWIKWN